MIGTVQLELPCRSVRACRSRRVATATRPTGATITTRATSPVGQFGGTVDLGALAGEDKLVVLAVGAVRRLLSLSRKRQSHLWGVEDSVHTLDEAVATVNGVTDNAAKPRLTLVSVVRRRDCDTKHK